MDENYKYSKSASKEVTITPTILPFYYPSLPQTLVDEIRILSEVKLGMILGFGKNKLENENGGIIKLGDEI